MECVENSRSNCSSASLRVQAFSWCCCCSTQAATTATFQRLYYETHRPPHTCLEDLVAHRESRPVSLVVGDELDEELAAAGDDRRRRDLPAELSQHGWKLVPAVVNLHVVVPGGGARRNRFRFTKNTGAKYRRADPFFTLTSMLSTGVSSLYSVLWVFTWMHTAAQHMNE